MTHSLPDESFDAIINAFASFPEIEQAVLFGSRAEGSHKHGSDVDIVIKGKNITLDDISKLSSILNKELPLPYFFDIIDYKSISNSELKKRIDNKGKIIYTRGDG